MATACTYSPAPEAVITFLSLLLYSSQLLIRLDRKRSIMYLVPALLHQLT